jgi:putative transcriptional regulator
VYTVVETPLFQRLADDYWTEEERSSFVSFIAAHPEAGNVVPGSEVYAKYAGAWLDVASEEVCASSTSTGSLLAKSGSSFCIRSPGPRISQLTSCARSRRKLSMAKGAKKLQLAKSGEELGEQLLQSVREMKAGLRGRVHTPGGSSIVEARLISGLSQTSFATLLGVSVRTLQDWEQGRREPSGAAKTLIKVARLHPEILQELTS